MTAIRAATPADVPALAKILQDWIEATPWMPVLHSRDGTVAFVGMLQRTMRMMVTGDGLDMGFLVLDGTEVEALYVAEAARGRGLGSALVAAAQDAEPRLALWTFQANSGARRFYDRHGFRELALTDGAGNDEKLPDVRLEWSRE